MFKSIVSKNIPPLSIAAIIVYATIMLCACLLSKDFNLKHSNGVILIAVTSALSSTLYHDKKKYWLQFSTLLLAVASIFLIKRFVGEPIELAAAKNYINFFASLINLSLLISSLLQGQRLGCSLRFLLSLILLLTPLLFWCYYCSSGAFFGAASYLAIWQTNLQEICEYLSDNFSWASLCLLIAFLLLPAWLARKSLQLRRPLPTLLLVFCLLCSLLTCVKYRHNILTQIPQTAAQTIKQYEAFAAARAERKHNAEQLLQSASANTAVTGTFVLVIGESQSREHMSAYGYSRQTTPWLSSLAKQPNLLLFTNAYSCHTHTVPTLLYALTAKNQYNSLPVKNAFSILEAAEAAGYETIWLSNQVKLGSWDTPITSIAAEANQQHWLNCNLGNTTETNFYDGKLVQQLKQVQLKDKTLIVLHLMGNHGAYAHRYPDSFAKYQGADKTINHYDNSMLYNDHVMQCVYEEVKQLPNFQGLVYVADHADAVDKGLAHDASSFDPLMTHIPLYMYLSDAYISQNQPKYQQLLQHTTAPFSNDLLFNLLLGLMNINCADIYEAENDITSASYDSDPARFRTLYGKRQLE